MRSSISSRQGYWLNDILSSSFTSLLDSARLSQHMEGPSHAQELVLTYGSEVKYLMVFLQNPILSYHSLISFQFACNNDVLCDKRICYSWDLSESAVLKFKEKNSSSAWTPATY